MKPIYIALYLPDQLCYSEQIEERDHLSSKIDGGVTEAKLMGGQIKIGYASGHLILIGNTLTNGLTFESVQMDKAKAMKLLEQVTEQEVKEFEEIMEYRKDCLTKEMHQRIDAYVKKIPYEKYCPRN